MLQNFGGVSCGIIPRVKDLSLIEKISVVLSFEYLINLADVLCHSVPRNEFDTVYPVKVTQNLQRIKC